MMNQKTDGSMFVLALGPHVSTKVSKGTKLSG